MKDKPIKWGRSEDGYVNSKCGQFRIAPLYWGCVKPQWFKVTYYGKTIFGWCPTQREAKEACEEHLQKLARREKQ